MREKDKPTFRHRELSLMFLKMGQSLVNEGLESKDYITATLGNSMIFMSTLAFDKNEVKLFSDICNMMSSRRLVMGVTSRDVKDDKLNEIKDLTKEDPFQEVFKRIMRDLGKDENGEIDGE